MQITLPWPPLELSPNFRENWDKKHAPKKKYYSDCFYLTKSQNQNMAFGKTANIALKITFHPKTKRFPDLDNCLSWIKHGLDGVAKALGINDKQFRPITIDFGDSIEGGKVVIEA